MITVKLPDESVAEVVLQSLQNDLEHVSNEVLRDAIHKTIAWYSIPETYLGGKYDLDQ
jgi:hypothetical protein